MRAATRVAARRRVRRSLETRAGGSATPQWIRTPTGRPPALPSLGVIVGERPRGVRFIGSRWRWRSIDTQGAPHATGIILGVSRALAEPFPFLNGPDENAGGITIDPPARGMGFRVGWSIEREAGSRCGEGIEMSGRAHVTALHLPTGVFIDFRPGVEISIDHTIFRTNEPEMPDPQLCPALERDMSRKKFLVTLAVPALPPKLEGAISAVFATEVSRRPTPLHVLNLIDLFLAVQDEFFLF